MRNIKKIFRKILSKNAYEWISLNLLNHIKVESEKLNSSIDKSDPRKTFTILNSGKKLNDLESFFSEKEHLPIHKELSYFDVYDRHLSKFRGTEITFVEVGVSKGGSLQMWKEYFGPKAKIVGIDIDPACKQYEEDQIKIFIGSQEDRNFWKIFKEEVPKVDVLLDDGGHKMQQQIVTFEEMFMHIQEGGHYLCEDLHTSYWPEYDGGYKKKTSFIEYSKNFIDYINAWHSKTKKLAVDENTKAIYGLHYYESILVIEKKKLSNPTIQLNI